MKKRGSKSIFKIILIVFFSFVLALLIFKSLSKLDFGDKIAVIPIEGVIGASDTFNDGVYPDEIISYIEDANKKNNIKAIILNINSPGGTVVASEEIANAVKKSKKPVVALIHEVGASGAYWIASASDKIVASPMSVTGSIGVTGSYLEFSKLMEKYGVTYNILKAGEYKETGSLYKELTPKEKEALQGTIDKIYYYFIDQVSINRNLTKARVKEVATGNIYLGQEAKNIGLIDELGDKDTAVKIAKELANIKEADLVTYEKKETLIDIIGRLSSNSFYFIGQGIGSKLFSLSNENKLSFNA